MKKALLSVFIVLCFASIADAQIIGGILGGGTGEIPPFSCATSGDTACDSFDCASGCQTCGDDGASQANCFVAWTAAGSGTITNQASGLETGTNYAKSITANSSNVKSSYTTISSGDSYNAFVRLKIGTLTYTSTTQTTLASLQSSGGTNLCGLGLVYSDPDVLFVVYANGSWQTPLAGVVQSATDYYIWQEYVRNTASTGCKVYISTSATKPAATGSYTSANTAIARYFLQADNTSTKVFSPVTFDRVRVSTSTIGDYHD